MSHAMEDLGLTSDNPERLLGFAVRSTSDRKLRLYAVAAGRLVGHLLLPEGTDVLAVAEEYADGLCPLQHLTDARERAKSPHTRGMGPRAVMHVAVLAAWGKVGGVSASLNLTHELVWSCGLNIRARDNLADIIRDIFGNTVRSLMFDPGWRTATAVGLAAGIYESRDFSPMPILADALEDAGCDQSDILAHCRGPGPHVRGCWVVDLVLGKS